MKKVFTFLVMIPFALLSLLLPGCSFDSPASLQPKEPSPPPMQSYSPDQYIEGKLSIHAGDVINPEIIGCGVNFSFSDYVYMDYEHGTQWTGLRSQHLPYTYGMKELEDKEWEHYMNLMDYMGFQYVRMGVGLTQWEPVNDNDDPDQLNLQDGFVFSPGFQAKHPDVPKNTFLYLDYMYRLLDHWEKKILYVVLANWNAGPDGFCPGNSNWLRRRDAQGKPLYDWNDREHMGITSVDELTESLAAIAYHLKIEKNYQCIQGLSFWNEPEQLENYEETLAGVYNSLGAQLRKLGIQDQIQIQGFDGAIFWNREKGSVPLQVASMMQKAGDNIDTLSFHDYYTGFEYMKGTSGIHGTIQEFMIDKTLLPALAQGREDGKERPVIAGECGSFALSGGTDHAPANYLQRLHSAEAAIQFFNNGGKAMGYWVYNNITHSHWSMLDFSKSYDFHFVPNSTNYYPLALTMKYLPRGSNIVKTEMQGLQDEKGNLRVHATAAVKDGQFTLLLVNDSPIAAKVNILGLPSSAKLRHHWVNAESHQRIHFDGILDPKQTGMLMLRPQSITVLTTYDYGTETVADILLDTVNRR